MHDARYRYFLETVNRNCKLFLTRMHLFDPVPKPCSLFFSTNYVERDQLREPLYSAPCTLTPVTLQLSMKILFVNPLDERSGPKVRTRGFYTALQSLGHDVSYMESNYPRR